MTADRIETASDGTRIYTHEQAARAFASIKVPEFSLTDLVLVLLGAQDRPVHGRTLLMKELFLLHEEVLKGRSSDPRFVKYRLGPHSFHMAGLVDELHFDGLLDRRGRPHSGSESFRLTPAGSRMAAGVMGRLSAAELRLVFDKRAGWDQLGTRGMLNYVYARYPGYRDKSAVRKSYADVVWD